MTNLESGPHYAEICCQTISCLSVCLSIKFRNLTPSLAIKLFTIIFALAKFEQAKNFHFGQKLGLVKRAVATLDLPTLLASKPLSFCLRYGSFHGLLQVQL